MYLTLKTICQQSLLSLVLCVVLGHKAGTLDRILLNAETENRLLSQHICGLDYLTMIVEISILEWIKCQPNNSYEVLHVSTYFPY